MKMRFQGAQAKGRQKEVAKQIPSINAYTRITTLFTIVIAVALSPFLWSFPELPTLELHPLRTPAMANLIIFTVALLHVLFTNEIHIRHKTNGGAVFALLFLFLLSCIASCIGSISIWESILELVNTLSFAVVFIAVSSFEAPFAFSLPLVTSLAGYVESLLALREYAFSHTAGLKEWRAFGTFQNPNLLGGYLAMCLPVMLSVTMHLRQRLLKLVGVLVSVICIIAIAVTGSKGAFMALLISLLLFSLLLLARLQRRRYDVLFLLCCLMLLVFATIAIPTLRQRIISAFGAQLHSWLFRIFVWKATLNIAIANPINGSGIGTFYLAYPKFTTVGPTYTAHNSFLQIASECGFLSLAIFIIFIVFWMRHSIKLMWQRAQAESTLIIGSICGVVSFLIHNIVDCTWYVPATRLTFALLLGFTMAMCNGGEPGSRPYQTDVDGFTPWLRGSRMKAILKGFAILALLLCSFISFTHVVATYHALSGRRAENAFFAIEAFERAISWEPLNARHRIALANALLSLSEPNEHKRALKEALIATRLQPTRAANYHTLARAYLALGEHSKAIRAYNEALNVNPHDTLGMCELARLYERLGDKEKALRLYERVIGLMRSPYGQYTAIDAPTDVNALTASVRMASLKLQKNLSERELSKLAEDLKLAIALGESYLGFFHPEMGEAVVATRTKVESELAYAYAYYALVKERLGDFDEAERARKRALELAPVIEHEGFTEGDEEHEEK
ncbi:MAG: hypothetical protein RUDDFDWM_001753 [Candidatus Fervidibacterota bacterium]